MGAIMGFDIPVSSLAPLVRRQHGVNVWVALLGIGAATVAVVSAMMRRRAVNTHRGDGAQGVDDGLQQDRRKDSPKLQGAYTATEERVPSSPAPAALGKLCRDLRTSLLARPEAAALPEEEAVTSCSSVSLRPMLVSTRRVHCDTFCQNVQEC
mmetsp:Transcript_105778/g.329742  ORF Transcript_105778/g.329742 Transcript_105778/m.329742 type:complete len:153 (+) Transcript_105778:32-490(+)